MADQDLFNSRGGRIAFRNGKYVFDVDGHLIGWLPRLDEDIRDVVTEDGDYIGTIWGDGRFYYFENRSHQGVNAQRMPRKSHMPRRPPMPPIHSRIRHPLPLPPGAEDVRIPLREG